MSDNTSPNNTNNEVAVPSETSLVPLKTIVDELQAEVRKLVAIQVRMQAEIRKLITNQRSMQAEIRQLKTDKVKFTNKQDHLQAEVKQLTHLTDNQNKHTTGMNTNNTISAATASPNSSCRANNDDDDVKRHLFTDSSHRYLFMDTITRYDGTNYKVGFNHKVIAMSVIVFQMFTYCFFGYLIFLDYGKGKEEWMTPTLQLIDSTYCYNTTEYGYDPVWSHYIASADNRAYSDLSQGSITEKSLPLNLIKCSDPTDMYNIAQDLNILILIDLTSALLLLLFLLPDLYEAFILMTKCKGWREKQVGAIIFSKALLATIVGWMGTMNVIFTGFSSTFLLVVGLVFVHEADEQFGYLEDIIERTRERQNQYYFRPTFQFGCFWWFVYIPAAIGFFALYFILVTNSRIDVKLFIFFWSGLTGMYFASAFAINALARRMAR